MEPSTELSVVAELDVDALVEAETNEIQWLFDGVLLFASHLSSFSLSQLFSQNFSFFVLSRLPFLQLQTLFHLKRDFYVLLLNCLLLILRKIKHESFHILILFRFLNLCVMKFGNLQKFMTFFCIL